MMRATSLMLCGLAVVSFTGCFDRGGLDVTGDGGAGMQSDAGHATGGAIGTGGSTATGGATGSGGQNGSGGTKGSGGTPGTGGSIGSGGNKGSGGTPGSGGGAGTPATGGVRGSGGVSGTGGNPGMGGTGGTPCGPVCPLILCAYGSLLDANGCPTCKCNPPPACTATDCGPSLGIPSQVCSNGTVAGPICLRDPTGKCAWVVFTCPPPPPSACGSHVGYTACIADTTCAWLQPGCGDPALAAAGCYAKTSIDCTSDAQCATGQQCLKRVVNPCYDPTAMVTCGACGAIKTVCQ